MIKIKQAVVVEGKYDKIRLSNLLDTVIITTDGFGIFKNKEKISLIKMLAQKQGVIILTDSDSAGFMIRNFINSIVPNGEIINICLPEIYGKEKRKTAPSSENLLGVEGTDDRIILDCFAKNGITAEVGRREAVTKQMLYLDGFSGSENCVERRNALLDMLKIPRSISPNMLPEIITQLVGCEGYRQAAESLSEKIEQNT